MEKLYDLTFLEEATGGNQDFMDNMVQLIIEDTPEEFKKIASALDDKDYQTVSSIAHKIKPSVKLVCKASFLQEILAIEAWNDSDDVMVTKTNNFITNMLLALNQLKEI